MLTVLKFSLMAAGGRPSESRQAFLLLTATVTAASGTGGSLSVGELLQGAGKDRKHLE